MKKVFFLLSLIFLFTAYVHGQSGNNSDGNTPLIWPEEEVCTNDLAAFSLPCCLALTPGRNGIMAPIRVASIAQLKFEGDPKCKPPVRFVPELVPIPVTIFDERDAKRILAISEGDTFEAYISPIDSRLTISDKATSIQIVGGIQATLDKFFDNIKKVKDQLNKYGLMPCEISFNKPRLNFTAEGFKLCCKDSCVKNGYKFTGDAKVSYGTPNCHVPIPGLSIPKVGSIDAVFNMGVSLTAFLNGQSTCTRNKFCAGLEGKISFGGGVGFSGLNNAVVVDGQIIMDGASLKGELCFYPLPMTYCVSATIGKVKAALNVQLFWGYINNTMELILYPGSGPYTILGCN